jgi:hypothetical protein
VEDLRFCPRNDLAEGWQGDGLRDGSGGVVSDVLEERVGGLDVLQFRTPQYDGRSERLYSVSMRSE